MSTDAATELSYEELITHNGALLTENADLKRTVLLLSHQLTTLKRGMFGRSSEKLSDGAVPLALFPEPEAPPVAETTTIAGHTRSKRNGRSPLPASLPRERVEYKPENLCCEGCGNELTKIGEDITEELDVVPAKLFVREHARGRYACSDCKKGVVTAKLPPNVQIVDRVRAGNGLLADIIVKKYCDHLPLHRQEKIYQRSGIELRRSTMCDWLGYCADTLRPIVAEMRRGILESLVIHADETPLDVATDDGMKRGYLWGYLGDRKEVVFEATMTRGSEHPKKFLGEFSRYLQADAYAGYNDFFEETDAVRLGCWSHTRRKFFDAKSTDPPRCKEILTLISQLFAVEREAKENHLNSHEHLALRELKARPVLARIGSLLRSYRQQVLPKSPLGQAVSYALKQWFALTRYLDDHRLRLDNNPIEQQIRPIAVGRHNWLFAGSKNGADRTAIFFSLINSCKLQGINPWEYLRDVLNRVNSHPQSCVHQLTPRGWKEASQ